MGTAVALTAALVAQATGGRVIAGDPSQPFTGVSIDTRRIAAGSLFVALRGDRFDGHDFLVEAIANGACGVLVSQGGAPSGAVVIQVDDTLAALQALARTVRRAAGTRVVAITGSAGKTTTKEVTADLLSMRFDVYRNPGNFNNHIGLPLSLIELHAGHEMAVVELGMNHAGEIRALVAIAEPDIRVWTNVGDAHVGFFGSREAVADSKAEILEGASAATVLVANADDPLVAARTREFPGRRVTFGEAAHADVRASDVVDRGFDGVSAVIAAGRQRAEVSVPLPGRVHLANVLAAVAVAIECGLPLADIAPRVAALRPVARRGASVTLAGGARVVDDSYNASPAALEATFLALASTPVAGRRIAVVGEMLELGDSAETLHEACGRAAARAGLDIVVAIGGPVMDAFVRGALANGLAPAGVQRFDTSEDAATVVARLIGPGDLVLVKGSRGTRTDVVVDHLKAVA